MEELKTLTEREEEKKKIIWFVTCSGAENGPISQEQLQQLAALKAVLPKLKEGSQVICGPDEQQRRTTELLGFYPNTYLPEYADLKAAVPLIMEELTRPPDGSIIFASPKLLRIIGAIRIVNGEELPGCYGFRGPLENCTLYKIFVAPSQHIEYIGRPDEKKPPWPELQPP